jgi:hypothetical protein
MVYLADNDFRVPLNGLMFPKAGPGSAPGATWPSGDPDTAGVYDMQKYDLQHGALWNYMSQLRKAYICPEDDLTRPNEGQIVRGVDEKIGIRGSGPQPEGAQGYYSYSVNSVLNSEGRFRENFAFRGGPGKTPQPWADPLAWIKLARPAEFITILEEDNLRSRFNDEVMDAPAYNGASTNGADYLTSRHANGGGSVGFGDGRAESINAVLFNNVPAGVTPAGASNDWNAMQAYVTRQFFPDAGEFAAQQAPAATAPATSP